MPEDRKSDSQITGFFKKLLAADQQEGMSINQATQTPRPIEQVLEDGSMEDAIKKSGLLMKPMAYGRDEAETLMIRPVEQFQEHVVERIKAVLDKQGDNLPMTTFYAHEQEVEGLVRNKIEALAAEQELLTLPPEEREKHTNEILNEAFVFLLRDSQLIHESATVADLHAHPGLKATWFGRELSLPYDRKNWLQRLFRLSKVAFDPTAMRTDFHKLRQGKVNILFSAVYAFEIEALYNFRITGIPLIPRSIDSIESARQLPASRIRKLLFGLAGASVLKYILLQFIFTNIGFTLFFFALDVFKAALAAVLYIAFDTGLQKRKKVPERPIIGLIIAYGIFLLIPILVMAWFFLPFLTVLIVFLFDVVVSLALFTLGATLLVQFRLFEPHINRYVLNDYNFNSSIGVIRQVDEAVKRNTVGDVRSARSLDEFEDGMKAVTGAKVARNLLDSNTAPDEPLLIMHSLEGAHCLHGKEITEHIKDIADVRKAIRIASSLGQEERLEELQEKQHRLDYQLQHDQKFEDETFANLYEFYTAGVAVMGLSHYYPNIVCQSTFSYPERIAGHIDEQYWSENWHNLTFGLTPIGKKIVTEMIRIGMMIDISHTSPATRRDIYQLATQLDRQYGWRTSIIASHIGVQGLHAHPYNLADWEIIWMARNQGLIGVMWSNFWLTGHEGLKLGSGYIVRTVDYIVDLLERNGIENPTSVVAFGSDLDGLSDPPDDLWDASRWPILTEVLTAQYEYDQETQLIRYRYTPGELRAFLGGNVVNAICEGWGRKQSDDAWNLKQQLGSTNNQIAEQAAAQLLEMGETQLGTISLKGANLEGIDFTDFDFDDADLQGANLFEAQGLSIEKLSKASSLEGALLPDATKLPGRTLEQFVRGDVPVEWKPDFERWMIQQA